LPSSATLTYRTYDLTQKYGKKRLADGHLTYYNMAHPCCWELLLAAAAASASVGVVRCVRTGHVANLLERD